MKKSAKVLLYFVLDCRMLEFFTHELWSKEWFEHMQIVIQTSRWLDSFLHEAAQSFALLSNIQDQKLKTYSDSCPFQGLSNGTTLMQIQSGRTVPFGQSKHMLLGTNV